MDRGGLLSTATISQIQNHAVAARRRSFLLVFCCTLIGAAAQMFIKAGANTLPHATFVDAMLGMVTNPLLFTGYALYGLNTLLMALALRDNELSLLFPVISLTYVWVSFLSVWMFNESMNLFKIVGIAAIVGGVGVLGRGSKA